MGRHLAPERRLIYFSAKEAADHSMSRLCAVQGAGRACLLC